MINILFKIRRYGVRRLMLHINVLLVCGIKSRLVRLLYSDLSPNLNKTKILQATQFIGRGKIYLDQCQLGVWPSPGLLSGFGYIEARTESAKVLVGEETFISNNFVIIADKTNVDIGRRCMIGTHFFVVDSDFHGLSVKDRTNGNYKCKEVKIGDDVFVGNNVSILKGVNVGNGSVIGNGSLVTKDIEPYSVYAGTPARFIKRVPD